MDRWVYGYGGMEGIGGVSYVTLTLPLLLFFAKKNFLVKRCDEAMKKRHCRLVSAVLSKELVLLGELAASLVWKCC